MKLNLNSGPLVAGVLSSMAGEFTPAGDIIEVRLDKTGRPPGWLERCRAIEVAGKPVLLTIRLRAEGGDWPADDDARHRIFEEALAALSAVDVELASVHFAKICRLAQRLGKTCIVSHHDFEKTPPLAELESIVTRAQQFGGVAKVAAGIRSETDAQTLRQLLSRHKSDPICVIGMGEAWTKTRLELAGLGSCLAYGYIDKSTAPGQVSVAELLRQLGRT